MHLHRTRHAATASYPHHSHPIGSSFKHNEILTKFHEQAVNHTFHGCCRDYPDAGAYSS
jgi:hypothetical protein